MTPASPPPPLSKSASTIMWYGCEKNLWRNMHQNIAHESFLHTIIKQTHFYKHYHQLIMLQQLLEDIFKKWSCSLPSQETISDPSKSEEDKTEVTGQEVVNPEDYIKHPLQNRLSFLLPIYQSTNTAKFEPKGSSDDLVHFPPHCTQRKSFALSICEIAFIVCWLAKQLFS